jgi:histone acetyltransferase
MEHKLDTNQYPNLEAFLADAQLIFDNCRLYNQENSSYYKNATKLEKVLKEQVTALRAQNDWH